MLAPAGGEGGLGLSQGQKISFISLQSHLFWMHLVHFDKVPC